MATFNLDITDALVPDPSNAAAPHWQPASIADANGLHDGVQVLVFTDSGTKIGASLAFAVPTNYVGTPVLVLWWTTTATTGNIVWDGDINSVDVGESADPSSYTESVTVTTAAAGTARNLIESTMALTAGNFAADDMALLTLSRDGASGSDTLAASAYLYRAFFRYNDA